MAYRQTRQDSVEFFDGNNGSIGGFLRSSTDPDQTAIGPIYSPNGTAHWIVVSNAGALSTVTVEP